MGKGEGEVMTDIINKYFKSIGVLILISFVVFVSIYSPMRKELEGNILKNFLYISQSKENSLQNYIHSCVDGGKSISSRTMIKNKIVEYKAGEADINQLSDYTLPRFIDGIKALDNCIGGMRIVDNTIIASSGESLPFESNYLKENKSLKSDIDLSFEVPFVRVISPIYEGENLLGHDVLLFELNKTITSLNREEIKTEILDKAQAESIKNNAKKIHSIQDFELIETQNTISYINSIKDTEKSIAISIPKNDLFGSITGISYTNIISYVVGILLLIIMYNIIIINNTKKQLNETKNKGERLKDFAYKDSVTGVHTRHFLEKLIKELGESEISVEDMAIVLIDIDSFKGINDNHGHTIGDKILEYTANALKDSIRDSDFVIRYGGDEFLLVLNHCKRINADLIIKKIEEKLSKPNEWDILVNISYGIQEVFDINDIKQNIQQADEKMYKMKESKKIQS